MSSFLRVTTSRTSRNQVRLIHDLGMWPSLTPTKRLRSKVSAGYATRISVNFWTASMCLRSRPFYRSNLIDTPSITSRYRWCQSLYSSTSQKPACRTSYEDWQVAWTAKWPTLRKGSNVQGSSPSDQDTTRCQESYINARTNGSKVILAAFFLHLRPRSRPRLFCDPNCDDIEGLRGAVAGGGCERLSEFVRSPLLK